MLYRLSHTRLSLTKIHSNLNTIFYSSPKFLTLHTSTKIFIAIVINLGHFRSQIGFLQLFRWNPGKNSKTTFLEILDASSSHLNRQPAGSEATFWIPTFSIFRLFKWVQRPMPHWKPLKVPSKTLARKFPNPIFFKNCKIWQNPLPRPIFHETLPDFQGMTVECRALLFYGYEELKSNL